MSYIQDMRHDELKGKVLIMNNVYAIIPVMFLIGCGGGEGFTTDNDVGAAGKTVTSGAAGKSVNVAGSAGVAVLPAGTGNVTVVAGGGNAPVVAGAAGKDPTDPTCRPKTCATVAVELSKGNTEAKACGVVEDGCGGYVDCGNPCGTSAGLECGTLTFTNEGTLIQNKNLCGGLCYTVTDGAGKPGYASKQACTLNIKSTTVWCPNTAFTSVSTSYSTCDIGESSGNATAYCCK